MDDTDRACIMVTRVEGSQLGFTAEAVDAVADISGGLTSQVPNMGSEVVDCHLRGAV